MVRPFVTRKGPEGAGTGQPGGSARVTGVGPRYTPSACRIWFGKIQRFRLRDA